METFRLQRLVYMYVFGLISSELHCLVPRETIPRLLLPVLVRLSCTSKRFRAIIPKLREGGKKESERETLPLPTRVCVPPSTGKARVGSGFQQGHA